MLSFVLLSAAILLTLGMNLAVTGWWPSHASPIETEVAPCKEETPVFPLPNPVSFTPLPVTASQVAPALPVAVPKVATKDIRPEEGADSKGVESARSKSPEPSLRDHHPRLVPVFHDCPDSAPSYYLDEPSMRFGLRVVEQPGSNTGTKNLTALKDGRSNNTCVRVDGSERLFGLTAAQLERLPTDAKEHFGYWPGQWLQIKKTLGKDSTGRTRLGLASIWQWHAPAIKITQIVEIIPGDQSRLLDTCLVRYVMENRDPSADHSVGLRFLLDTQIGANDGVPFLIPGDKELCDTCKEFNTPAEVPDYIQALERYDLQNPGTVAALKFKLGKHLEAPARVTIGVWPGPALKLLGYQGPFGSLAPWEVPVLPIKTPLSLNLRAYRWWPDSAVVMYWPERRLRPLEKRVVGFSYGLGQIAASNNNLGLTVGGLFYPGEAFTVTALVTNPRAGETVTLALPKGFKFVQERAQQPVPPLPANASTKVSPVTWKVRRGPGAAHAPCAFQLRRGAIQSRHDLRAPAASTCYGRSRGERARLRDYPQTGTGPLNLGVLSHFLDPKDSFEPVPAISFCARDATGQYEAR